MSDGFRPAAGLTAGGAAGGRAGGRAGRFVNGLRPCYSGPPTHDPWRYILYRLASCWLSLNLGHGVKFQMLNDAPGCWGTYLRGEFLSIRVAGTVQRKMEGAGGADRAVNSKRWAGRFSRDPPEILPRFSADARSEKDGNRPNCKTKTRKSRQMIQSLHARLCIIDRNASDTVQHRQRQSFQCHGSTIQIQPVGHGMK